MFQPSACDWKWWLSEAVRILRWWQNDWFFEYVVISLHLVHRKFKTKKS